MNITGVVYKLGQTQTFDSGFKKRVIVIKTMGDYPQTIPFEFLKDRADLLNGVKDGDMVTVSFDIRGNEYNGKFYVNLVGFKIDATEDGNKVIAQVAKEKVKSPMDDIPNTDDDLPF